MEWIVHTCVCVCGCVCVYVYMCMYVFACRKVMMLAHEKYMWQQTYGLCFLCSRRMQEHHQHFEAPSPACLSGWAPEFSSWTHWPDRPPSPGEWIGPLLRRIFHDRLESCGFSAICKLWRKLCTMDSTRLGFQNGMLSEVFVSVWGLWQGWTRNITAFVSAGQKTFLSASRSFLCPGAQLSSR